MNNGMTVKDAIARSPIPFTVEQVQSVVNTAHTDGVSAVVNGGGPAINLAAARVLLGENAEYVGMNALVLPVYRVQGV